MNKPRRAVLLLLALLGPAALGGCGTVLSLFDEPQPYSGVKYDLDHFDTVVRGSSETMKFDGEFRGADGKAGMILLVLLLTRPFWCAALLGIDIGVSAVADTALLPVMLVFCRKR